MAYLQAYLNRQPAGEYPLQEGTTTIGRHQDNRILLDDRSVSGHHARIRFYRGVATIHDLESTNGTFVNGETTREATLQDGDFIIIGKFRLRFWMQSQDSLRGSTEEDDDTYILRLATPGLPPIVADQELSARIRQAKEQVALSSSHGGEGPDPSKYRMLLRIISGRNQGRHLDLLSPVNTLGEPGRQIVALIREKGQLFLQILASELDPPLVNKKTIDDLGRHPLKHGDILEVAGVHMMVNIETNAGEGEEHPL